MGNIIAQYHNEIFENTEKDFKYSYLLNVQSIDKKKHQPNPKTPHSHTSNELHKSEKKGNIE